MSTEGTQPVETFNFNEKASIPLCFDDLKALCPWADFEEPDWESHDLEDDATTVLYVVNITEEQDLAGFPFAW